MTSKNVCKTPLVCTTFPMRTHVQSRAHRIKENQTGSKSTYYNLIWIEFNLSLKHLIWIELEVISGEALEKRYY